jgi:hypothetical protein
MTFYIGIKIITSSIVLIQATNALRNVKYIAEFPLRIQEALASVGFVECYEAKRFIVKEGGAPDNAYIVLYGSSMLLS